jgi:hypothetical protein
MKSMDELVKTLDLYLVKKAPALPKKAKDVLVTYSPWIALLVLLFSLSGFFALFGLGSMFYSPLFGPRLSFTYELSLAFLLVTTVLRGMSIKGLMERKKSGWNLVFYSILVSAVYSLLSGDIGGLVIGTVISLYIAFQIREYYK